ncbi:MAG: hypothetical protein LBM01_01600 [Christensenellaceae bacterium]|jgi:hypothetical protein|nr:hypothetical protein [Christensenellaceae bacterium]
MLDKRTRSLLSFVLKISDDDKFKVVEIAELNAIEGDAKKLGEILSFLSDGGYIEIKYSDEEVYCLRITAKGRLELKEKTHTARNKNPIFWFLIGGLGFIIMVSASFLGNLLFSLL